MLDIHTLHKYLCHVAMLTIIQHIPLEDAEMEQPLNKILWHLENPSVSLFLYLFVVNT